jgi:hypothetical protein
LRNSHIPQDKWLVDPDGYTIVSACGRHEKAWELEIDGDRRGALTNFLFYALCALRKRAVELHTNLYISIYASGFTHQVSRFLAAANSNALWE